MNYSMNDEKLSETLIATIKGISKMRKFFVLKGYLNSINFHAQLIFAPKIFCGFNFHASLQIFSLYRNNFQAAGKSKTQLHQTVQKLHNFAFIYYKLV